MVKSAINVLLVVLAAWVVPPMVEAANTTSTTATKDCKQSNDFKYTPCGEWGKNYYCCKTRQTCVGPVTPKTGNKLYACSSDRQLSGQTFIRVVLIPTMFLLMDILFIVYMVLFLNFMSNNMTKLCVAVILFSWPLYMSSLWAHGCWSAFLALFVAQMSNMVQQEVKPKLARFNLNCQGLPSWVYYLTWVLELFQVIVIFGPTEAFHVPFFGQSKTTAYAELLKGTDLKEATCDKYFGNYFKVLSIEKQAKEADPDLSYGGFCSLEFLGFVQSMFIFQGILWMMLLLATAPRLLSASRTGEPKEV